MAVKTLGVRKNIFRSVFPTDAFTHPTPQLDDANLPGEDSDATEVPPKYTDRHADVASPSVVNDQVRWDRAWEVVTARLRLPSSVALEDSFGPMQSESQDDDPIFREALAFVLHTRTSAPHALRTEDIVWWHVRQARRHFVHHVLPLLSACAAQAPELQALNSSIRTLHTAERQYSYGLTLLLGGLPGEDAQAAVAKRFWRGVLSIAENMWPMELLRVLAFILSRYMTSILRQAWVESETFLTRTDIGEQAARTRDGLFDLLDSMRPFGLAKGKFRAMLARVVNTCMHTFIKRTYSGVWDEIDDPAAPGTSPKISCIEHLSKWVDFHYAPLVVHVVRRLGGHVSSKEVPSWKEVAIGRLATLRIHELYDIVLGWPGAMGALDDLRCSVTTPQRRLQLTDAFSLAMHNRLLHLGRSTLEILRTYISMIRTFHLLDPSKVLLDRVVPALQLYLCKRDDAIRLIVTGLLSEPNEAGSKPASAAQLSELAMILDASAQQQDLNDGESELDWNDMSWSPAPADAGANYKRPKREDVIGAVIDALGSEDVFIKEFESVLAERLLSTRTAFEREVTVLVLLKQRFGEGALQNCDVMVRDILDSHAIDAAMRERLQVDDDAKGWDSSLAHHVKILSRLFWPGLAKSSFRKPAPIVAVQKRSESAFEQIKKWQKLHWLDHAGSAVVRLDLEDRSVEVACKTSDAAVIYAFHSSDTEADDNTHGDEARPQQRNVTELRERLDMDEDLLDQALRFWVGQRVLRVIDEQTYAVVERADQAHAGTSKAGGASGAEGSPAAHARTPARKPKGLSAKEKEQRTIFWQYIVGMLTNASSAMPTARIATMMKMLIPNGCPWSNEQLEGFLEEKVAEGELEFDGNKYRLPKK